MFKKRMLSDRKG